MELPAHYDPAAAARWGYEPDQRSLFEAAAETRVAPASADGFSVELVAIDLQRDFCFPQGSLFVAGRAGAGAVEDSDRIARLIYGNLERITALTDEARLNELGHDIAVGEIVTLLSTRLAINRWRREHPELARQPVTHGPESLVTGLVR